MKIFVRYERFSKNCELQVELTENSLIDHIGMRIVYSHINKIIAFRSDLFFDEYYFQKDQIYL